MDINLSRKAVIIFMAFSGCISKQLLQNHEYDDLYYTSRDRHVLAAQKAEQVKTEPVKVEERTQPNVTTGQSDTYIYHYDSKQVPKPVPKPDTSADSVQKAKTEPVKVEEKKQTDVKTGQSDTYIYHYDSKDPKPVKQDQINNSNQNVAPDSNTNYNSNTNNNSSTPSNPADSTKHH